MNTKLPTIPPVGHNEASVCDEDVAAVLEQLISGKQADPATLLRVQNRAEQITAKIRREHGLLDDGTFQALLDDEA